jgi:hypothetical protein
VHFLWEWQQQNLIYGFYFYLLLWVMLVKNESRFFK